VFNWDMGCNRLMAGAPMVAAERGEDRNSVPRRPDFIAVGPPRTATTWFDKALRGHVGLPRGRKETDFFKRNYGRGLTWYLEYFRECPSDRPCGEICPTYFPLPEVRARMASHLPGVKVVVTLRDPVERAYSYYRMLRRYAWVKVGFEQAVEQREDIRDCNRYAYHLSEWQRLFGKEHVCVLLYDDLKASPQDYVDCFCDFISAPRVKLDDRIKLTDEVNGVGRAPRSKHLAQNARNLQIWLDDNDWWRTRDLLERWGVWRFCYGGGEQFPALDHRLDTRLRELFVPEVEQLEQLIGRDLSVWKTPRAGR
jgi:Sulfotransferase domain